MNGFQAVQWNRAKLIYDAIVLACMITYVVGFIAVASWMRMVCRHDTRGLDWAHLLLRDMASKGFLPS
jgi:hypothetical protein